MSGAVIRFGIFEFDPGTGELRRDGTPVRLQAQPARALAVLLRHAGETVTREALQREVWSDGTHVDFERGLNFCIAQLRTALRDSADSPRYIQTVPRAGYRFIAPVSAPSDEAPAVAVTGVTMAPVLPGVRARHSARSVTAAALVLVGLATLGWTLWAAKRAAPPTVIVVPFYNETGRPDLDLVAKATGDATVVRLATPERLPLLSVIGNAGRLQRPFARADVQEIAQQLGATWVVIGQLKSDGERVRVLGHLIRASDMKHVWAQTFDGGAASLPAQTATAEAIAAAVSQAVANN